MSKKSFFFSTTSTPPPISGFQYGAPAGAGGTTGGGTVKLQYLFDETNSPFIDEAQSISIGAIGSQGTSVVVPAPYNNLSPGRALAGGYSTGVPADVAASDIGTDDFVLEWVLKKDGGTNPQAIYETNAINAQGAQLFFNGTTSFTIFFKGDGGGSYVDTFTIPNITGDGLFHKLRVVGDRDGNCELWVDGVLAGSSSMAAIDGLPITGSSLAIGSSSTGSFAFQGTMTEFRLTTGTITANSGGTGGG